MEDLEEGSGATPSPGAMVVVHYVGVLWDGGQEFDSSWDRGEPARFDLDGVVPGFSSGIAGDPSADIPPMKVGGRRRIVIPPGLGYGDQGAPPVIPPGATLVFVVDLIAVQ